MFFSIVIPVYKAEQYIERCVNSILSQDFTDIEIILVDDGSSDKSGRLCDQIAQREERVLVEHKTNGGAADARNVGINSATGEYILFLDSDDYWNDTKALNGLFKCIQKNRQPDVICYGTILCDENGNIIKSRVPVEADLQAEEEIRKLVYRNEYISASYVKAVKRSLIIEKDLFFRTTILSEDIEWSGRVLEATRTIGVFSKGFVIRICGVDGSLTSNIGRKNFEDIIKSLVSSIDRIKSSKSLPYDKKIYFEYWAYQYAMLLSLAKKIRQEPDYNQFIDIFQKYKWLLRYDHVKKVKAVKYLVTLFGIKNTITLLSFRLLF